MWVDSVIHVGGELVALRVEQLEPDERERTAAVLAWLTLDVVRCRGDHERTGWQEFVQSLLHRHVSFAIPDERLEDLGSQWWGEAVSRALVRFVQQNELSQSINRHLEMLRTLGSTERRES